MKRDFEQEFSTLKKYGSIPVSKLGQDIQDSILDLSEIRPLIIDDGLLVAVDISSKVDVIYGVDLDGREITAQAMPHRLVHKLVQLFGNIKLTVCIENCSGAGKIQEELSAVGYNVRPYATDYCVLFNKGNKDDYNDAKAIYRAALAYREPGAGRKVVSRIYMSQKNLIDSLAATADNGRRRLESILHNERVCTYHLKYDDAGNVRYDWKAGPRKSLYDSIKEGVYKMHSLLKQGLIDRIVFIAFLHVIITELEDIFGNTIQRAQLEAELFNDLSNKPEFMRLMSVPGVGPHLASLFYIKVGDVSRFKNARSMAAWAGLVPSHTGSGGKIRMGHMTNKGCPEIKAALYESVAGYMASHRSDETKQDENNKKNCFKLSAVKRSAKTCRVMYKAMSDPDFVYDAAKGGLPPCKGKPEDKLKREFSNIRKELTELMDTYQQVMRLFERFISKYKPIDPIFKSIKNNYHFRYLSKVAYEIGGKKFMDKVVAWFNECEAALEQQSGAEEHPQLIEQLQPAVQEKAEPAAAKEQTCSEQTCSGPGDAAPAVDGSASRRSVHRS